MLLRVKLAIDNIRKITLELPGTVKELHSMLKAMFNLQGDFVIQYEDPDFHNELCNLINITDLPKDKATLEIVFKCSDSCFSDSSLDTASGHSLTSDDAFTARLRSLPESFTIPFFSYDVEYRLKQGNEAYKIDGSVLSFSKDMKIDILDWLANAMYEFKAYPDGQQYESVAKALTEKHPCLKEPGSKYGWHQWKFRLKFKMANYRRKLSTAGCPEVSINRLKRRDEHSKLVKKKKKAKRLELNFLPTFPQGKTAAVLEEEWKALVEEMSKKKIDWNLVDKLMLSTFALWRWVIVEDAPLVSDVKSSWPALFTQSQVTAEFTRLLCKNLQASFMEGLDVYVPRLLQMYRENGAGIPELRSLLQCLEKEDTNQRRRAVALLVLPYFLREKPRNFIKVCQATDPEGDMIKGVSTGIIIITEGNESLLPKCILDVAIVFEETITMNEISDVANAFAVLIGLLYAVNVDYPCELRYTFEFLQKVVLKIGENYCSAKIHGLRNKLLRYSV